MHFSASMKSLVLWTLICLFAPFAAWASTDCSKILTDLNQNDPRFGSAGLFSQKDQSLLCGPVCVVNALVRLGYITDKDLVERLIHMLKADFPAWGIHGVPNRGMYSIEVYDAVMNTSDRLRLKTLAGIKIHNITQSDIMFVNKPGAVGIALHSGWGELRDVEHAKQKNITAGHFAIVTEVKKRLDGSLELTFDDPFFGPLKAIAREVSAPKLSNRYVYRLDFSESDLPKDHGWRIPGYIRILTEMIFFKRK